MINFDHYKSKMTPSQLEKYNLSMVRIRSLVPEARDQILNGIDALVSVVMSKEDLVNKSLVVASPTAIPTDDYKSVDFKKSVLVNKYDKLKTLSKVNFDVTNKETAILALAKVLNTGTYHEGACCIYTISEIISILNDLSPECILKGDE